MNRSMVRAFSMIELMIVILVIGLIVAILLPALGSVRTNARDQATRNLMASLSQAISQFELSEKRLPGVFSAQEIGATENTTWGFTPMDNIMLELAGGIVPQPDGVAQVGPVANAAQRVWFNPSAVGIPSTLNKGYFTPDEKYYKMLDGTQNGTKVGAPENKFVPSIVDANGMPILGWTVDPMSVGPITGINDFARQNSGGGLARFYHESNFAMLASNSLGKKGVDQSNLSLLSPNNANRLINMMGMLGAPGSPQDASASTATILPSAARGSFVLQSAGSNGVYLGSEERGAAIATGGALRYGFNFKNAAGNQHLDSSGKPTSLDIMKDFDDILISGN